MATKKELNEMLVNFGNSFMNLRKSDSYTKNYDLVKNFLFNRSDVFLGCLSSHTLKYLTYQIDGLEDPEFDISNMYREDYSFLECIGVLDKFGKLNPDYLQVVDVAFRFSQYNFYVKVLTMLKGLLDIYGYISIENVKKILLSYFKNDVEYVNQYFDRMIKTAGIIKYFYTILDGYFIRNEILCNYDNFMKEYELFDDKLDYKIFDRKFVRIFANSFAVNGTIQQAQPEILDLFLKRSESLNLDNTRELEAVLLSRSEIDYYNSYCVKYPKWLLKGHNVEECREIIEKVSRI